MKLKNPDFPFFAPRGVTVNNLAPGVINTDRSHAGRYITGQSLFIDCGMIL